LFGNGCKNSTHTHKNASDISSRSYSIVFMLPLGRRHRYGMEQWPVFCLQAVLIYLCPGPKNSMRRDGGDW